jgi:hypothetical protein
MFVWQAKKSLAAANAALIAASQSPGAGAIALTSTPVVLDTPRRVLITSGGNDSGITFTVTGTNQTGNPLTETITGGNATAVSTTQDFGTVTSVTHSGSVATTVSVGTSTTASTPWYQVNSWSQQINIGFAGVVSGTVTYQVDYTYDDPNAPFSGPFPTIFNPTGFTALTATKDGSFTAPVNAIRFTITAGAGTLVGQVLQSDGSPS